MDRGAQTHLLATAYHESGHALACLKVGRYVSRVVIRRDAPGSGAMHNAHAPKNPFDLARNRGTARAAWEYTYRSALDEIFVCLAGPLAEAKATATPLRQMGNRSDLDRCIRVVSRLKELTEFASDFVTVPAISEEALFNQYRQKVRRWVGRRPNWRTITAIADQLMMVGEIDGEELSWIIGASRDPSEHQRVSRRRTPASPRRSRKKARGEIAIRSS